MIPKRLVHGGTVGFAALFRLARPDFDWLKLMVLGIQTSRNPTDSFNLSHVVRRTSMFVDCVDPLNCKGINPK